MGLIATYIRDLGALSHREKLISKHKKFLKCLETGPPTPGRYPECSQWNLLEPARWALRGTSARESTKPQLSQCDNLSLLCVCLCLELVFRPVVSGG